MIELCKKILKWFGVKDSSVEQKPFIHGKLLFNAAQCNLCGDICVSRERHDMVRCLCRSVGVDGGLDYQRIMGYPENYTDLSVYSNEPFEKVRQFVEWGSRGKKGDEPITYIKLKDISDTHLMNLLGYLKTEHFFKDLTLKEQKYRKEHKIEVKDAE